MTSSARSKNGDETTNPPTRSSDPKGSAHNGSSTTRQIITVGCADAGPTQLCRQAEARECRNLPMDSCRLSHLLEDVGRQCAAVYRPCVLAFGAFDRQHGRTSDLQTRFVMTAFRTGERESRVRV